MTAGFSVDGGVELMNHASTDKAPAPVRAAADGIEMPFQLFCAEKFAEVAGSVHNGPSCPKATSPNTVPLWPLPEASAAVSEPTASLSRHAPLAERASTSAM